MSAIPYIYEYIRCRGFAPLYVEQHLARLEELSRRLFLSGCGIGREVLERKIEDALREGGYSERHTNAVLVRRYIDGGIEVECVDNFYDTFSLRAVRPQGYVCHLSGDAVLQPTSAKAAALALHRATAEISDEGVAVWLSDTGEVKAIDGGSVVAVFDDEICFSQSGSGVEFELAYRAAQGGRRRVCRGEISHEDITRAKELLYIDYRGITALLVCEGRHYMDIVAEHIARQVADIER